jgi:hypothetical protein
MMSFLPKMDITELHVSNDTAMTSSTADNALVVVLKNQFALSPTDMTSTMIGTAWLVHQDTAIVGNHVPHLLEKCLNMMFRLFDFGNRILPKRPRTSTANPPT